MTYPDGQEVLVGDSILFEKGRTPGQIVAVISNDLVEYNVSEPGVMVKAAPFGLVFVPASQFPGAQVALEERGKSAFRWPVP